MEITIDEYEEAVAHDLGWCILCQKFTRDTCEPDAECYECPECNENKVFGAETALMRGDICLAEDEEEDEEEEVIEEENEDDT